MPLNEKLHPYAGRWVALAGEQVVGQGGTPEQALKAAKAGRFKEKIRVEYVSTGDKLIFSPLVGRVRDSLPKKAKVYLVGGAVRDAILQRNSIDLDFAVAGDALKVARRVARELNGAYYRMDDETQTGRVILMDEEGQRQILDFTKLRGPDIESDLAGRDFTVNAMAVDLREPQALLDPVGGVMDLSQKRLRACSPKAFEEDPVRVLRAVRLAAKDGLHIEAETRTQVRAASGLLPNVSPERNRDELFKILAGPQPAASITALEMLGALLHFLPELAALKGLEQSPPHASDGWTHTLHTMQHLETILRALEEEYDPEKASNLHIGLVVLQLGRYRKQIQNHLRSALNVERAQRPLLFLAALYHDVGKPKTRSQDEDGRIRFLGHEGVGAEMVEIRARELHLSNPEVERLKSIVANHLRPQQLASEEKMPSRRAVYRFFRDTGEAGVDVCLLALADLLATYETTLSQTALAHHLEVLRTLLEAWWEAKEERVSPPQIVDGDDLMWELRMKAGPKIGEMLEAIREAQAAGEINSREEALEFARFRLVEKT